MKNRCRIYAPKSRKIDAEMKPKIRYNRSKNELWDDLWPLIV